MKLRGHVHRYGDNVDTDAIIPARYLNLSEPAELAAHCMEDFDAKFLDKVQPGDVIVAGSNFGCGSSREHAPMCIKAVGVAAVIAASFARILYRNAINIGLPILECPEAAEQCETGDSLSVDLASGEIANTTKGLTFQAKPYPEFMLELIEAGGLVEYTRRRLAARPASHVGVSQTGGISSWPATPPLHPPAHPFRIADDREEFIQVLYRVHKDVELQPPLTAVN